MVKCGFALLLLAAMIAGAGCQKQTACMKRLGAKNCHELFDKCQQSQSSVEALMECTRCYDESCRD